MASISSIKTMHGAFSFACPEQVPYARSAHAYETSPTKSETAYREERHVGFPCHRLGKQSLTCSRRAYKQRPFWYFAPEGPYISCGFLRKSTISITSTLASSSPATSLNVVLTRLSLVEHLRLGFAPLNMPPPAPPPALRGHHAHYKYPDGDQYNEREKASNTSSHTLRLVS